MRTYVCFPTVVQVLSGCEYVAIGARDVWVSVGGVRRTVPLKAFTPAELACSSADDSSGNKLAWRAREIAFPEV